jgi:hypothetical protein
MINLSKCVQRWQVAIVEDNKKNIRINCDI